MAQVKAYRPESKSISNGQVLQNPYSSQQARTVVMEMADSVSYDLLEKGLGTDQLVLTVGYDVESLTNPNIAGTYRGSIHTDRFGRKVPTHSYGTVNISSPTSSAAVLVEKTAELYDRIVNPDLLVRRLTLSINHLIPEVELAGKPRVRQLGLFDEVDEILQDEEAEKLKRDKERRQQEAILQLRQKYGKNVILKGLNFAEGATQKDRNSQIGGHKA